jgi:hypothetical protein
MNFPPTMNATFRLGLFLILCSSVNAGGDPQVRVASSRELRVAVVDASKRTDARDAMHQSFAATLGAALTQQCGGPVGVRATCVGVDHAAFNLNAGVYDAVFVVGATVPSSLRKVEAMTLSATPESGKRDRMLYLMIANGDASLQRLLSTAFTQVVADEKFLESFAGADGKAPVTVGKNVAAAMR